MLVCACKSFEPRYYDFTRQTFGFKKYYEAGVVRARFESGLLFDRLCTIIPNISSTKQMPVFSDQEMLDISI